MAIEAAADAANAEANTAVWLVGRGWRRLERYVLGDESEDCVGAGVLGGGPARASSGHSGGTWMERWRR
jgi:hypothetical protein